MGVILVAAMATGLVGCGGSSGTGTSAAAADTQVIEVQKEGTKDDAKREDEKKDSEVSDTKGASDFRIGIVIDSASQPEDDGRGAEAFQAIYGEGMVKLAIYPGNFMEKLETTAQTIINLSDDPKTKAIIMSQSVPGTTEAFRKTKEARPDILCITGEGHEDLPKIGSTVDLVCNNDFVARGYLIIRTAHELSCDTFICISLPHHMAYETMGRHVTVMKKAYGEFGMEFVLRITPDPTSDVGVAGAQAYILEKVSGWVKKYGENVAYFCTNDVHTESLLKQLMEYGGYFIEADLPSPLMGYPGALGIDLVAGAGDFNKILAKVESTIVEKSGANHFGTWTYSYGYTASAGLTQRTLNVLNGESELDDIDDIVRAYQAFSPKAKWNGSNYANVETSVKLDSVLPVCQDTYIMGGPGHFMGSTKIETPEKYFTIK